jgi:hypothetical protein
MEMRPSKRGSGPENDLGAGEGEVWVKGDDEQWRLHRDIWNSAQP